MSETYNDWSQVWESHVAAIISEEDSIKAEIEQYIHSGDLQGASMACFDHVITSMQLGDHKEAYTYMVVGQVFAHADMELRDDTTPYVTRFHIPACAAVIPKKHDIKRWNRRKEEYFIDEEATDRLHQSEVQIREAITKGLEDVETLLGLEVDPLTQNEVLRDAIAATCKFIFSKQTQEGYEKNTEKTQLLTLAKQLTSHLVIGGDESNTKVVFDALERFTYAAIYVDGRVTLSSLNFALKRLEEMQLEPVTGSINNRCEELIVLLKQARRSKLGVAAVSPLLNTYAAYKPYIKGTNEYGEWKKAQVSKHMKTYIKSLHDKKDPLPIDPIVSNENVIVLAKTRMKDLPAYTMRRRTLEEILVASP